MAIEDRVRVEDQAQARAAAPSTGELIDRLSSFDGPPEQFLLNLLAVQCYLSTAEGGAILRLTEQGVQVVAVYPQVPQGATAPVWLAHAVETAPQAAQKGTTSLRPVRTTEELYGQPATHHLIQVPIRGEGMVRGLACFHVEARDAGALVASRERLELTVSLLAFYEMRLTLQRRGLDLQRIRLAMETLAAVNEHDHFTAGAMTICNEVASRVGADRVSLGFLKGRYVHLKATSHTEKFNRKMQLVQDIESAMEECLDQDVEIYHPAPKEATFVNRATKELCTRHGPTTALSLPLRRAGEVVAVLTVERPSETPFTIEEAETLRLTCDLCTARLANLHETDRWFGARVVAGTRKLAAAAVGPKHTWVKLLAVFILAAGLFMAFAHGSYDAEGTVVIQPVQQRVVPAPFEAVLQDVFVDLGQPVKKGDKLADLDVSQLATQKAGKLAEREASRIKAAVAWGDPKAEKRAEAQVAEQDVKRIDAEIAILDWQISQGTLLAPIDGVITAGDLKRLINKRIQTGDVMFIVSPLENLRAEIMVPEDDISEVRVGYEGEFALTGSPGQKIRFTVTDIVPVAEVVNQKNVFKVRAKLAEDTQVNSAWLLAGMEGVAKIHVGEKPYGELWSRKLVNWIRMKLWI